MSVLVYLCCAQLGGSWTACWRFAPARMGRALGPVSPIGTLVTAPKGIPCVLYKSERGQGVSCTPRRRVQSVLISGLPCTLLRCWASL